MANRNDSSIPVSQSSIFHSIFYIHLRHIVKLIARPPSFFSLLDAGNQTMMEILWNADDIPKSNKLKFTDNFMTTQSDQIRREYRRWRFEVDRETV